MQNVINEAVAGQPVSSAPGTALGKYLVITELKDFLLYLRILKICRQMPAYFKKILEHGRSVLPLLENNHPDFMPHPLAIFANECFHCPNFVVIDPSSDGQSQFPFQFV